MAITTAMCNSFKQELLEGIHDMDGHTFKVALIKASPTDDYGAGTKSYDNASHTAAGESLTQGTNNDELGTTGTNYTAGGNTLANPTVTLSGSTAFVDFDDSVFSDMTASADGALIYNSSAANRAVAVFDFGQTVTATSGDFTVVFPTADASNAVIRIS